MKRGVVASIDGKKHPIETLGINFDAPGQYRDANGMLWVEWPNSANEVSPLTITVNEQTRFFKRHSSAITGTETPWIFASGLEGATDLRIGMTLEGKAKVAEAASANADSLSASEPIKILAEPKSYAVRLYFGAPVGGPASVNRVFDVVLDNLTVLTDVSIADGQTLVRELSAVNIGESFRLQLVPKAGVPVLSGIELRRVAKD